MIQEIKKWLTGFRKFIAAMVFLAVGVILLVTKQVPPDTWMQHMATVMTAFMATNVGEHIIETIKEWIRGKDKVGKTKG